MGYSSAPGPDVRVAGVCEHTVTETMERRKFVIGMGSLAAGGAAATGTGAFTSAEVDRYVNVDVADDSAAYLGLEPAPTQNGKAYARVYDDGGDSDGQVVVDFNGISDNTNNSIDPETGSGVNADALFTFDDVIRVTNQGSQQIDLTNPDGESAVVDGGLSNDGQNNVAAYISGPTRLDVGEDSYIGFVVSTGDDTGNKFNGDVVIEAEQP